MDTANKFLVSVQGDLIVLLGQQSRRITRDDAVNLAAWLVALADPERVQFDRVFDAVCNT